MKQSWIIFFAAAFTAFFLTSLTGSASEWKQFDEAYRETVAVPLNGRAFIYVDLPAEHLMSNRSMTLHINLETHMTYSIDGFKQKSFEGFTPKLSVNGGLFRGNYTIRVKSLPTCQTSTVKIKTSYLKAGRNTLKFYMGQNTGLRYTCKGGKTCNAYSIHEIRFACE